MYLHNISTFALHKIRKFRHLEASAHSILLLLNGVYLTFQAVGRESAKSEYLLIVGTDENQIKKEPQQIILDCVKLKTEQSRKTKNKPFHDHDMFYYFTKKKNLRSGCTLQPFARSRLDGKDNKFGAGLNELTYRDMTIETT